MVTLTLALRYKIGFKKPLYGQQAWLPSEHILYCILWIVPIDRILKLKTCIFGLEPCFRVCLTAGSKMNKLSMTAAH